METFGDYLELNPIKDTDSRTMIGDRVWYYQQAKLDLLTKCTCIKWTVHETKDKAVLNICPGCQNRAILTKHDKERQGKYKAT